MLSPAILVLLGLSVTAALVLSGLSPYDRPTWFLEVLPVLIAAPILILTRRRFPLTALLYLLITLHALVLIYGGAHTYARVPLGDWMQAAFDFQRNPYDRLGHFMQGLVPSLLAREILLRGGFLTHRGMAAFLSGCVALAVSAVYELIEWAAALAFGQGAAEFLGTQGDPWDTQSDIFMALLGALFALSLLVRLHDRQIAALVGSAGRASPGRTPTGAG